MKQLSEFGVNNIVHPNVLNSMRGLIRVQTERRIHNTIMYGYIAFISGICLLLYREGRGAFLAMILGAVLFVVGIAFALFKPTAVQKPLYDDLV